MWKVGVLEDLVRKPEEGSTKPGRIGLKPPEAEGFGRIRALFSSGSVAESDFRRIRAAVRLERGQKYTESRRADKASEVGQRVFIETERGSGASPTPVPCTAYLLNISHADEAWSYERAKSSFDYRGAIATQRR